ncbi:MAG: methyltransferase domain-containing protein [bacterium]|nr:methyltransferase domain-containing protein [bacterium]
MAIDTLERIYPKELQSDDKFDKDVLSLHIARYRFAAKHVKGKRILDIACGSGYGSEILLSRLSSSTHYVGVDRDLGAIRYAKENYKGPGIKFLRMDAMRFKYPGKFDSIVCLETLEHLFHPEQFVEILAKKLSDGGILIASIPITLTTDVNPHHLHDFTEKSFISLFTRVGLILESSTIQVQRYLPLKLLFGRKTGRARTISRGNLAYFYLVHPKMILLRLWSVLRFGFSNRYMIAMWINTKYDKPKDR